MSQTALESHGASWQDLYVKALLELDPHKLPARIKEAEQAIASRNASLDLARDSDEFQRLSDAMNNLSVLRREAAA